MTPVASSESDKRKPLFTLNTNKPDVKFRSVPHTIVWNDRRSTEKPLLINFVNLRKHNPGYITHFKPIRLIVDNFYVPTNANHCVSISKIHLRKHKQKKSFFSKKIDRILLT